MADACQTRVLVVGLGSIGRRHARLLSERHDVVLTICDQVDEFRRETSATLHRPAREAASLGEALAVGQDAVIVATPNRSHVPVAMESLAAGADLLVEKPLAHETAEAARLVDACRRAGRFLQVGYMLRCDPGIVLLKRWTDDGSLGRLVGGRAMIGTYVTLLNAKSPFRLTEPNSLVVDYTHELDFLRWIFGPLVSVSAAAATLGTLDLTPQPNVLQMGLRTRSGGLVQVHMDYVQFPQRRILEIYGDRGTASYDFMTGEIRRFACERDHRWTSHDVPPIAERWDDLFRWQHDAFLSARRDGRPPLASGDDGLAAMRAAEAAIAAATTGRWVEIPDD